MPHGQAFSYSHNSYMPSPENKYRPYAHKVPLDPREDTFPLTQANKTYLSSLADLKALDFDEKLTLKELSTYAGIRYLTTGLVFPFAVGETLLQVQYLPSDEQLLRASLEEGHQQEHADSDDPEFYDVNLGYDTQPRGLANTSLSHALPPLEAGVWDSMQTLARHPTEGWLSLWKGQFTNWVHDMGQIFLQPSIEAVLNDTFDLYDDTIPLVHLESALPNVVTMVTSHVVTGVVLSPLEIIRTRLMVQSSSPHYKKYKGFFHALKTIIQEEGLATFYWSYNLFPTILYHALTPLIGNTIPLVIDRFLNLSPADSPLLYSLAELGLNTLQLIITMPVDTIRKRLQCQIQSQSSERLVTIVSTRSTPYYGVVDCAYRIITEEGGSRTKRSKKAKNGRSLKRKSDHPTAKKSWWQRWGVQGLYRGSSMRFAGYLAVFANNVIGGTKDEDEW
ncbi:mitochondrial carrier [Basidiobolus meristosporus CBS 931.73]|uniref:Mitochondrial carrier n=1 Tax=Basidiobolus meristosporus CBS 931.73 TaxID=1314790 RepID=A0A1Y1YIX9_9FUNG|nr:mitochondrial carrier [Basidiobolus meristosporus CBS 931.73]|eukprot:ORX97980.1 mitochondrial carrier [Basidiobolus meristosporus CBS 931.73]